jgi:hypothetical protein
VICFGIFATDVQAISVDLIVKRVKNVTFAFRRFKRLERRAMCFAVVTSRARLIRQLTCGGKPSDPH